MAFILRHCYEKTWIYQSVKQDWSLPFKNRIEISQSPQIPRLQVACCKWVSRIANNRFRMKCHWIVFDDNASVRIVAWWCMGNSKTHKTQQQNRTQQEWSLKSHAKIFKSFWYFTDDSTTWALRRRLTNSKVIVQISTKLYHGLLPLREICCLVV